MDGPVRVFRQKFALEDSIGSHACSLEAKMRVTNGIPLRSPLALIVCHHKSCRNAEGMWLVGARFYGCGGRCGCCQPRLVMPSWQVCEIVLPQGKWCLLGVGESAAVDFPSPVLESRLDSTDAF
jgi:hypothetical protein